MNSLSMKGKDRRSAIVLGAVLATINAGPTPAQSQAPGTTQPVPPIADRIHEALAQTGTVEPLALELGRDNRSDPAEFDARARVALEQGELATALVSLNAERAITPKDPALLRLVASVEEKLGQTAGAEDALRAALAETTDRDAKVEVRLRLALLAFDDGRDAEGVRLLDQACQDDPGVSAQAGVIACLFGQYEAAARLIGQSTGEVRPELRLLQGNAALRAGKLADATAAFDAALGSETDVQDRRYTQERLVATARRAGTLPKLADKWIAQPQLPSDELLELAGVLRELGRVPELLTLWQKEAGDPQRAAAVLTPRFMNEVIGASQEAGLNDQAEKQALGLLALAPDNDQALSVVIRMLVNHGKPADADALIARRVAASANQPDELDRLGKLARSFGRDDAAIGAAHALRALGNGNAIAGFLLEASIRLRSGQKQAGLALLHEAADAAKNHPDELRDIATAFEAADQDADAVAVLQSCLTLRQPPDDITLERLASLLLQMRKYDEATPILQSLRVHGTSAAIRAQAGQRLLEVAMAERTLDSLIAGTRAALDAGTASEADLTLLVDAYMRSGKTDAAAEVLKDTKLLDRKTALSRLAVLYLRTGKLTDAGSALRELVAADPDNAVGTLERLASVELDLKQPKAAAAVIDEIASRIGKQSASFSGMMGGIYDRLNQPARAAAYYRRALAVNPENADTWLLWSTATAKSGGSRQAIGRLLVLCDQAKGDNVFSIAVDGLLNLKAPPAALRAARRDAILRASAASQQTMLFQVISDLSEELQDGDGIVRALDASVAVNREERPQVLRELMEYASGKGLLDEANACGLSMLALDDSFPPQLMLGLGERLLIAGRVDSASRAFTRAAEIGSDEQVAPQAADLFEQYGSAVPAFRELAPLAQRKPNDWSIQQTFARLCELAGQTTEAFDTYRATLVLADRELASLPPGPFALDAVPPPEPDLTALVNGAIATARSPEQKRKLFDQLRQVVDRDLDATPVNAKPSALFLQWFAELHRAGFALGLGDAVDRADTEIIARRPDLPALVHAALAVRLDQGLFDSAERFARTHGAQSLLPAELFAYPAEAEIPPGTGIDNAVLVLPRLLSLGRTDQARHVLKDLPVMLPKKPADQLPTLIAAAMTLDEPDLATQWVTLWTRQIVDPPASSTTGPVSTPGAPASIQLQNLVQSVWPILPTAARAEIAAEALVLAIRTDGTPQSSGAATLALRLAAETGIDVPDRIGLALKLTPEGKYDTGHRAWISTLAERTAMLPAADRPEFISRAIRRLPPDSGLAFLEQLVALSVEPFDAGTDAAIIEAAQKLPNPQTLVWSSWFTSSSHPSVLPALAAATLRATAAPGPDAADPVSTVAAAVALSGQQPDLAQRTATDAIQELMADDQTSQGVPPATTAPVHKRQLPAGIGRLTLVHYAVAVLGPGARTDLLESLEKKEPATDLTPDQHAWVLAVKSVVLDSLQRRDDGFESLHRAFVLNGANLDIQQAWLSRLQEDGREAELAESFDVDSPKMPRWLRTQVVTAMESLFRGREVPLLAKAVGVSAVTPRRTLDFMTPRASDDRTKLAETLRIFLERPRTNGDGLSPIIESDADGLPRTDGTGTGKPIFYDVARWPGSIDDLLATFGTLPQGRYMADQVTGILIAATADPAVVHKLLDHLEAAEQSGVFTANDRMLVERLAVVPGVTLPTDLRNEIWNDLLFDPTGDPDVRQLSRCLHAQNDPHADDLQHWAAIRSQVKMVGTSVMASRSKSDESSPPPGFDQQAAAAARRGDMGDFKSRVERAVTDSAWAQISKPTWSNLSDLLPSDFPDRSRREQAVGILRDAIERAATRWPDDTNWTRSLAALGRWCHDHGDDATAKTLLDEATDLGTAQGIGEHQLWVADLADLLGQPDRAWTIQRRLLENRCLPAVRIPGLLQHMDATGQSKAADLLAKNAATYCNEPNLLRRLQAADGDSLGR
jgi:tetratricopeptide (TPR) repeat protein